TTIAQTVKNRIGSQLNGLGLRLLCQSLTWGLLSVEGFDGWDGCAFEVGTEPPVQSDLCAPRGGVQRGSRGGVQRGSRSGVPGGGLSGGLSGVPGGALSCCRSGGPGGPCGSRGGGLGGAPGGDPGGSRGVPGGFPGGGKGGELDLPAGVPSSRVHSSPYPLIRFPARRTLPQQRCFGAVGGKQTRRHVVPSVEPADEPDTTRHQLVTVVNRRMVRARLSHIERRSQPTEDLWASGQVVAVHAWLQLLRVEVPRRPPAHTGIAADAAV